MTRQFCAVLTSNDILLHSFAYRPLMLARPIGEGSQVAIPLRSLRTLPTTFGKAAASGARRYSTEEAKMKMGLNEDFMI